VIKVDIQIPSKLEKIVRTSDIHRNQTRHALSR